MLNLFRSREQKLTKEFEKLYFKFIFKIIDENGEGHPLNGMYIEAFIVDYTKELMDNLVILSKLNNMTPRKTESIIKNAARNIHKQVIKN